MARADRYLLGSLACLMACTGSDRGQPYSDPTALSIPSDANDIRAYFVSPESPSAVTDSFPEIIIAAYTISDSEPLTVELARVERDADGHSLMVGTVEAAVSGSPGEGQRFAAHLPLVHGRNTLFARIRNADGTKVRSLSVDLDYAGAKPGASLGVALPTAVMGESCSFVDELVPALTNQPRVCLHGRVTSRSSGVLSARIVAPPSLAGVLALGDDNSFRKPLLLPEDTDTSIEIELTDDSGESQHISTRVIHDGTPPDLTLTSSAGETLDAAYHLAGRAGDDNGIADVRVETGAGSRESLGSAQPFALDLTLTTGDNRVRVIATDNAGNESSTELTLSLVRTLSLGPPKTDVGTTNIEVDRQSLTELLTDADQREIELVSVDLTAAVRAALRRIRSPELYAVDVSAWGAPERNLQRILQMTPDVADLSGTSVAELLDISSAVGLPSPRLLADILQLSVTDYILDLDTAAAVIVDKLVGSHPNIGHDADGKPVITITMADVIHDLAPLAARFGPSGAHPGFLSGQTSSKVLEPGFLITFPVHSNLVQFDAVDLSRASKDYLFVLAGERVLDFNILTDAFNVVGLADEPTIDLRFTLQEASTFVRAGATENANPDAADPGFYRGDGAAFALSPWLFEHISAESGYRQLHRNFESSNFARTLHYDAGSITDAAVIGWSRGFLRVRTAGNLGSPPAPLYAWDLLTETAQVRLHDGNIAEGAANMAFTLDDLPIGLSADQLVERLRPKLHAQEDKLSEQLVGKTGLATANADVFFAPSGTGKAILAFRAEEDGGGSFLYPHVGFFADVDLATKLSATAPLAGIGGPAREQVEVSAGATYYAADSDGSVHALSVASTADGHLTLHVTHVAVSP